MNKAYKYIIGLLLTVVCIYFSIKGIDFDNIIESLKGLNYFYLASAFVLLLLLNVIRYFRWRLILSPISKINHKKLIPIFCVGFMAVVLLPMRGGELARPYLLKANKLLPFSSSLATIFLERVFDFVTIIGIFFILIFIDPFFPSWFVNSGYIVFCFSLFILLFMFMLYFKTEKAIKFVNMFIKYFPVKFKERVTSIIQSFVEGFKLISSPSRVIYTAVLSLLIWIISGIGIYYIFQSNGLNLTIFAAFVVLVVNIIGISLPAAPGMLGTFQLSCIVGLSLFDITKDHAFTFAMIYYLEGMAAIILPGLLSLPFTNFSFGKLKKEEISYNLKSKWKTKE